GATVLIALYTTAAYCEPRVSLAALAPTVVVVAVLSAATADAPGRETPAPSVVAAPVPSPAPPAAPGRQTSATFGAIIAAGLCVGSWGLGAYAQTRRRYLRELRAPAAPAQRERERL